MKAALIHAFKQPLRLEEAAVPSPGPDEVLIRVEACGVCHSDMHLADGDWARLRTVTKLPLIPGHEVVGRVIEKGAAVSNHDVGDRVGVAWTHWTCGACELCSEGKENLCTRQTITGATVDGGYAEFLTAKASHALKAPAELSPAEAAPLFCAGVTVYRAIKKARIEPGQRVAIFGVGGLGHLAVQIAKHFGAHVIAIDVAEDKLEFARSLGAGETIDVSGDDAAARLRKLGGVHVAVVTSGAKRAYDAAFDTVRAGGTLVVVGMPAEDLTFQAIRMREITITSTATGTRDDLREVLELAAAGKIACRIETRPLDQINETLDDMRNGRITGRVVLTF